MSSIDPIQQPVSSHADANGMVPATTKLWDKNAALVDQQLQKTTASQQSNGWINLPSGLTQDLAGIPRYHTGGATVFRLSGSTLFFERVIEAVVDGIYCTTSLGNSDDPTLEGFGIGGYAPAVNQERQHALVLRNQTQLDSENWPTGVGRLLVLHGAPGPIGASPEVNTGAGELVLVKLKTVNDNGTKTVSMLPYAVPKARLLARHDELPDAGAYSHAALDGHLDSRSNPHQVTLGQAVAADPSQKLAGSNLADFAVANQHIALGTITEDRLAFSVTNSISKILYPHLVGEEGTLGVTSVPDLKGKFQLPMDRQILLNGRLVTPTNATLQDRKDAIQSYVLDRGDLFYPLDTQSGDDPIGDRSASMRHDATAGTLTLGKSSVVAIATTVPLGNQKERWVVSWGPSDANVGGYVIERYTVAANNTATLDAGGYPIASPMAASGVAASGLYAYYHSSHTMDSLDYVGCQHETSLDFNWGGGMPAPVAYAVAGTENAAQPQWAVRFVTYLRLPLAGKYQFKLDFDTSAVVDAKVYSVANDGTEAEVATFSPSTGSLLSTQTADLALSSSIRLEVTYKANVAYGADSFLKLSWRYGAGSIGALPYVAMDPRFLAVGRKCGFYTHAYRVNGVNDGVLTQYVGSLREGQLLPTPGAFRLAYGTQTAGYVRRAILNLDGTHMGVTAIAAGNHTLKIATTRHVKVYLNDVAIASGGSAQNYTFDLGNLTVGTDYDLRLESWGAAGATETLTLVSAGMPADLGPADILYYLRPDLRHGLKLDLYALGSGYDGSNDPFVSRGYLNHAAVTIAPSPDHAWTVAKPPFHLGNSANVSNPYRFAAEWTGWLTVPTTGLYRFQLAASPLGMSATLDTGASTLVAIGTAPVDVNLNAGVRVRVILRAWQKLATDVPTFKLLWNGGSGTTMTALPLSAFTPDLFVIDEVPLTSKYQYRVSSTDTYLLVGNLTSRIGETPAASGHPGMPKNFRVDNPAPTSGTISSNAYGEQTTSIALRWDVPDGTVSASSYRIWVSTTPNSFADLPSYTVPASAAQPFVATGLTEGTVYYFCIAAVTNADQGPKNFLTTATTVDTTTMNVTATPGV